jgi:hypothetical protein
MNSASSVSDHAFTAAGALSTCFTFVIAADSCEIAVVYLQKADEMIVMIACLWAQKS